MNRKEKRLALSTAIANVATAEDAEAFVVDDFEGAFEVSELFLYFEAIAVSYFAGFSQLADSSDFSRLISAGNAEDQGICGGIEAVGAGPQGKGHVFDDGGARERLTFVQEHRHREGADSEDAEPV